ncbi:MDS1 and EVI1 complex locus protein EVI1-A [Calliphora vicina]|uniref:MDS1 and EVI1 complex locus protein EVI1-A n=1 Tax=Calliphora vicina TaxID=7373 RepID=UPI00325B9573
MQADKDKIKKRESIISKQNHIIEEICEDGAIQYNCTACRKCFRSRSQKYYHLNCNQLQNLIYKCEHCDKSFVRHSQWKYHNESHLSPVNECNKCQKIFSNPLALKKHVALHKVEPKSCPHCNKTFKKKISLDQHVAAQHLNQLQYGCAQCSKKYASKSTLQLHLQSHEKKRFECSFCGKQFQRNSILNLHLKRHNNTNVICNVCQKVYSESGALARHRKIHEENGIQYHCKLCDKIILRKDNMTRHLNTIHPDEKFDNIVEVISPPTTDTNVALNQTNMESDNYKLREKHLTKPEKNVVIIENKLLHKPFELKDSINDLPNKLTNKIETVEYPLINQINVITPVPTYEQIIENTSLNCIQHYKTTDHQQQVEDKLFDPVLFYKNDASGPNCDLNVIQNEFVEELETNAALNNHNSSSLKKSQNQTLQQNKIQDTCNNQEYIQHHILEKELNIQHQSSQIYEPPKTQTISSVIRSIGNVKNLSCPIVAITKPINQTCTEYKHKKYCRNNYNIDLYRKILGCDDEDDEEEEEEKVQQTFIQTPQSEENLCDSHMMKLSTPVHWRKSFKNNYETWSS